MTTDGHAAVKSTYMHIQVTRHAKHKTRLDKTPRRDMRRHTYTTNTARQAQQDKHKTRLAHIKTGTTRQAQAQHDKHNMTSTPTGLWIQAVMGSPLPESPLMGLAHRRRPMASTGGGSLPLPTSRPRRSWSRSRSRKTSRRRYKTRCCGQARAVW